MDLTEVIRHNQLYFSLYGSIGLLVLTALAVLFYKLKIVTDEEELGGNTDQKEEPVPTPLITTQSISVAASAPVSPPSTPYLPPPTIDLNSGPIIVKAKNNWLKIILFVLMILVILGNTFYLIGSTLYINMKSVSGGPVHWHADFELWNCGEKLDLINPIAPSNRVGTALLHEHNDERIHVEEAIFDMKDVSLGSFMKVVGGEISDTKLVVPTNRGVVTMENGQLCPDGNPGTLQVFVYKTDKDKNVTQTKIQNPQDYMITGVTSVPPGDCIIMQFDSTIKEQTAQKCTSYIIEEEKKSRGN